MILPSPGEFMLPTKAILVPVMKVASDDEAIGLMNCSEYGLTASIWTRDLRTARDMSSQIECGTVFVNNCNNISPVGVVYFKSARG